MCNSRAICAELMDEHNWISNAFILYPVDFFPQSFGTESNLYRIHFVPNPIFPTVVSYRVEFAPLPVEAGLVICATSTILTSICHCMATPLFNIQSHVCAISLRLSCIPST